MLGSVGTGYIPLSYHTQPTVGYNDPARIENISDQVHPAVIPSTNWPFSSLTQTIQLGIGDTCHFCVHNFNNGSLLATTVILEHSFTLLQQGEQDLGEALALAAGEYMTSQTQATVEEAVKEVLHTDDRGDDKLSKMIIDIILKNSMSKVRGVRK
ncbi:hypothetical protein M405DRAFT_838834 [Rhizopogon salebrosus TDB-379]|nr:hypothetical protein M405DRAFT_838834 [Rhizopogon salebrosus TDB-379]